MSHGLLAWTRKMIDPPNLDHLPRLLKLALSDLSACRAVVRMSLPRRKLQPGWTLAPSDGRGEKRKRRNPLNFLNNGSPILESERIFSPTGRIKTIIVPLYTINFLLTGNASFSTTVHTLSRFHSL